MYVKCQPHPASGLRWVCSRLAMSPLPLCWEPRPSTNQKNSRTQDERYRNDICIQPLHSAQNLTKMALKFCLVCFYKSTSPQVKGEKQNKKKEQADAEGWEVDLAKLATGTAQKQRRGPRSGSWPAVPLVYVTTG